MSHSIGVFTVKNQFTELLRQVQSGEVVHITRHGTPIATLSPYKPQKKEVSHAIQALAKLSSQISLRGINVKGLIEAGRK